MEYYFGDQLRWSLGFENPNHAAACVAGFFPFVWMLLVIAGRPDHPRWRRVAIGALHLLHGFLWVALVMTYSRGGLVAAGAGCVYWLWKWHRAAGCVPWKWVSLMGMAVFLLIVFSGLAQRSTAWVVEPEGSVSNRFEVWKGGLRLVAAVPFGVGTGNSGECFMNYFQPLEMKEGYRTLVNSPLTLLAERGVIVFGLGLWMALLFWFRIRTNDPVLDASMKSVFLISAVAGFFSTTFETPGVWVAPVMAVGVLAWKCRNGCHTANRQVSTSPRRMRDDWMGAGLTSLGVTVLVVGGSLLAGHWMNARNALELRFDSSRGLVEMAQRGQKPEQTWWIAVDPGVLGPHFGRLLQRTVMDRPVRIRVCDLAMNHGPVGGADDRVILCGEQVVHTAAVEADSAVIWVAPSVPTDEAQGREMLKASPQIIFLPGMDQGQTRVWQAVIQNSKSPCSVIILEGVGRDISWKWNEIAEKIFGAK
ncbi:MAG: O-antigen ligase family protein [Verrucomicrobiae bacterium]|nr:O-antigen ligase family protein [Verrucomicrobiae bacterium]